METKLIEKVRENVRQYDSKAGKMYVHMVTVDNDEWEYHSVRPECTKFTPGQMADFTTEVKQNGQYTNKKISPAMSQGKKGVKDDVITALSSVSTAANFYNGTTSDENKLMALADKIFTWAKSKQK